MHFIPAKPATVVSKKRESQRDIDAFGGVMSIRSRFRSASPALHRAARSSRGGGRTRSTPATLSLAPRYACRTRTGRALTVVGFILRLPTALREISAGAFKEVVHASY